MVTLTEPYKYNCTSLMMQSSTLQISNLGSKAFAMDIRTHNVMANFSHVLLTGVQQNVDSIPIRTVTFFIPLFSALLYLVENLQSAWGVFFGQGGGGGN